MNDLRNDKSTGLISRWPVGIWLSVVVFVLMIPSCREPENAYVPKPYEFKIPQYFPTRLNIPSNNPITVEGVQLGRYLFYDGRLSGRTHPDSLMSCGTCHLQENSFECGINHPRFTGGKTSGITGIPTPHVMLPLVNLVWNESGYFWSGLVSASNPDPHKRTIEDIVYMGVVAPHEMAADTQQVKTMIQSIPGYPDLFEKAFGTRVVTFQNISKAIAQFVRTLISYNSRFDRYLRGEISLTESELSGFVLFMTEDGADCFHCHGGDGNPLFTTNLFYNNAKDTQFSDTRDRYSVTGDPGDIGAYKAPTLRNIELTSPYMHDGRFSTLEEVIDFYSQHLQQSPYVHPLMHHVQDGGIQLLPSEKADLIAFIKTLRDDTFLTDPAFSKPDQFPDGNRQN
jgi:cytochrome c peroxidase